MSRPDTQAHAYGAPEADFIKRSALSQLAPAMVDALAALLADALVADVSMGYAGLRSVPRRDATDTEGLS